MSYPHGMPLMTRHASPSYFSSIVIDDASHTSEDTNLVLNEMKVIHGKIKEVNGSMNVVLQSISKSRKQIMSISKHLLVSSKGCGKKIKSKKVIAISRLRLCRECGL